MLALKPTTAQSFQAVGSTQKKLFSQSNRIAPDLSEKTLTEFLNQPKRARLTHEYDFPFLAPVEIVARAKGRLVVSEWLEDMSPFRAIDKLRAQAPSVDILQLSLVTGRVPLGSGNWREAIPVEKNGRFGLEVRLHGLTHRVSPLGTIASNKSLDRWLIDFLNEKHLSESSFFSLGGQLHLLECRQFILHCGKSASAVETYRGSVLITGDQPIQKLTDDVISGIARWFISNQSKDGALPYKYWPSSGTYSTADNPIRRFMASVAFNRMASSLGRQDMKVAARKNLDSNMRRFYQILNGCGVITWQDSVKLGSLAMAGLAIIESQFGDTWKEELSCLHKSIDLLWQPSGAFKTFLFPPDRNDNQNFYPGEALLFWATSLQQHPNELLLERALKSIFFYREHFRKNPNPAFVPWHTQAALILYRLTLDPALQHFIFEMNDWLLAHQQWGGSLDRDYWGRFYTPKKPSYGPPHASATGVYLEGLVDALVLARETRDIVRIEAYDQAINRGIRSIAQLQFRDDIDTYYINRKERVVGAVRTESNNNEIRIDNLQHALMALLKYRDILQENGFEVEGRRKASC